VEGEVGVASGGQKEGEVNGEAKELTEDEVDTMLHTQEEGTTALELRDGQQQELGANEATSPAGRVRVAGGEEVELRDRGWGKQEDGVVVKMDVDGAEALTCEEVLEGQMEQQQQELGGAEQVEQQQQQKAGGVKCGGTLDALTGLGSECVVR
jgi:hypothetical protein